MKTKIENLENYNFFIDEKGNIRGEAKVKSLNFDDAVINDKKRTRTALCYNQFSEESAKKLQLFSKIQAIADYANGDWVADWSDDQKKYSQYFIEDAICIREGIHLNCGMPYFKSKELALQAYNDNKAIFDEFFSL